MQFGDNYGTGAGMNTVKFTQHPRQRDVMDVAGKRWSAGPAPTTKRGKRRHAARSEEQKKHAVAVWDGGY